jgi:hypothetical protein
MRKTTTNDMLSDHDSHVFSVTRDKRPRYGFWAPGYYYCKCTECKEQFVGDKKAVVCAPCAYHEEAENE